MIEHLTSMWHLYLMAAFYIFAGIQHFRVPKFFLAITPPWVPRPEIVNQLVGIIEIILGVAILIPRTKNIGAVGIMALLVAVFPANLYHFQKARAKKKMVLPTLIRLPVQLLLIWWAYSYYTH
ncbi:MAG: MauE/DoxX family redox-associated membrane protein [Bacteroidota bacterium]